MTPESSYLIGLAAAVYVTTCLVGAAVRWFHMCSPYDRKPRYYYPGRPFVTGVWLSSLALLPYVLDTSSADAWFLARLYFLPVTLFHFVLILSSYFGAVMDWKKWRWPVTLTGIPVVLVLLAAVALAVWPGDQIAALPFWETLMYILGGVMTALCIAAMSLVVGWARRVDPDDYSNPSDFPVVQARKWLAMVVLNLVLCWFGALMNDPGVLACVQMLISGLCVVFLISALHPNRNRPMDDTVAKEGKKETQVYLRSIPKRKQAEILSAIRTVVETQQAFLDPHLTLQDVANRCGYNRTYIAGLVKSELGGFVSYVNGLRMEFVGDYLQKNPDATLGEAVDAAGFGSRSRYYDTKSKMQGSR
ncbi:MAG: hypothetical protein IJU63_06420 [Bacteroidales bacterium]|nr:hypothetical protein [Bacteroidales bacterium]